MAWTDTCKIEAVRQVDHHIEKGQPVRKALKLVSEESEIPVSTLDRWKYPRKPVVKNDDKHKPEVNSPKKPVTEPTVEQSKDEKIKALMDKLHPPPMHTKRQKDLQEKFWKDEDDEVIIKRAVFHVMNSKNVKQMRVGDKLSTVNEIISLRGKTFLSVRVTIEKARNGGEIKCGTLKN